jgi:hypothetical protein
MSLSSVEPCLCVFSCNFAALSPDKTKAVMLDRNTGELSVFDTQARETVRRMQDLPGCMKTEEIPIAPHQRFPTYKKYTWCAVQAMRVEDDSNVGLMLADTATDGEDAENFVYTTLNVNTGQVTSRVPLKGEVPSAKNPSFLKRSSNGLFFWKYKSCDDQWHVFDVKTGEQVATREGEGDVCRTSCNMPGWLLKNNQDRLADGFVYYNPGERVMLRRLMDQPLSVVRQEDAVARKRDNGNSSARWIRFITDSIRIVSRVVNGLRDVDSK